MSPSIRHRYLARKRLVQASTPALSVLAANLGRLMAHTPGMMTQKAVAARAGVDQRSVGRILNRENNPRLDQLEKLAVAFGLHAWQILVTDMEPSDPPWVPLTESEYIVFQSFIASLRRPH